MVRNLDGLMEEKFGPVWQRMPTRYRHAIISNEQRIKRHGIQGHGRTASMVIEITQRCNLRCAFCYSTNNVVNMDMDLSVLYALLRLARRSFRYVFFTGGEPSIHPHIIDTIADFPDVLFFMFTNGNSQFLETIERFVDLDNLIIMLSVDSIESGDKSLQSLQKTVDCLEKLQSCWGVITRVDNNNANEVLSPTFIDRLIKVGAIFFRYIEHFPFGMNNTGMDQILTGEQYYKLTTMKRKIINDKKIYMQDTQEEYCSGLLYIDVMGNIKLCPFFDVSYGRALKSHIATNRLLQQARLDWTTSQYRGECPAYSDPCAHMHHLISRGWMKIEKPGTFLDCNETMQAMKRAYWDYQEILHDRE